MPPSLRIVVLWTADDAAHVVLDGHADPGTVERLERVLDLLERARARHVTVGLARLTGPQIEVLELLAAHWHRLRTQRGCLHLDGLAARLVSNPEVAAFPELFGPIPGPLPARARATSSRSDERPQPVAPSPDPSPTPPTPPAPPGSTSPLRTRRSTVSRAAWATTPARRMSWTPP